MRKPSVFSRDYERHMRKRRKRIFIMSLLGIFLGGLVSIKIALNNTNMEVLRNKVQNWINEDNNAIEDALVEEKTNEDLENSKEEVPKVNEEVPKVTENKIMDLKVNEEIVLKAEYEEIDGKIQFKEIKDNPTNIYYTLNPNKSLILTIDSNQNMKIFNVNKNEAIINKDKYISPDNEVFNKDSVLKEYKGYLWNVDAKFINDTTVAYISNVPYFGYDLNKYIWIVNLNDNTHKTIWNSKGKDIKFGEIKEKGLEVTIDGASKFINSNGELLN